MTTWLGHLQRGALQDDDALFPSGDPETPTGAEAPWSPDPPTLGGKHTRKPASLRAHSPTPPPSFNRRSAPAATPTTPSDPSSGRTWKGLLGKRLKRNQGPGATTYPPGASFGVPIPLCPMSEQHDGAVPLVVAACVEVVQLKGLRCQGLYRIPGNKAAVTHLTEALNRNPTQIDLTDPRWGDVNVISSLLKQFFQRLPEPLVPSHLHPLLLQAAAAPHPHQRLLQLRTLVHELPMFHYETLRLLCLHLQQVVQHSQYNKMDAHNLAIVFGPTLLRATHDDIARMVTDTPRQCSVVEALISHAGWFFSDAEEDQVPPTPVTGAPLGDYEPQPPQVQALLDNAAKLSGLGKSESKKVLVSSIISAASRKVHKSRNRRRSEEILGEWGSRDLERSRDGGEVPQYSSVENNPRISSGSANDSETHAASEVSHDNDERNVPLNNSLINHSDTSSIAEVSRQDTDNTLRLSAMSPSERSSCSDVTMNSDVATHVGDSSISSDVYRRHDGRLSVDVARESIYDVARTSLPSSLNHDSYRDATLRPTGATPSYRDHSRTKQRIKRFVDETKANLDRQIPVVLHSSSGPLSSSGLLSSSGPFSSAEPRTSEGSLSSQGILNIAGPLSSRPLSSGGPLPPPRRRTSVRLDFDKQSIDAAWLKAKKDLEEVDPLDLIADNPSEVLQLFGHSETRSNEALSLPSPCVTSGDAADEDDEVSLTSLPFACAPSALTNVLPSQEGGRSQVTSADDGSRQLADDGSDFLKAITATFEKMRSEGPSEEPSPPLTPPPPAREWPKEETLATLDIASGEADERRHSRGSGEGSGCRLYRDPSLHRRTGDPRGSLAHRLSVPRKVSCLEGVILNELWFSVVVAHAQRASPRTSGIQR
ncbi:GTPase-activating protein pac-1 [Hyalella azteca]|uniref:GTPase-activating protein pac-1 n=1 Tax=Hyalella azteca TaxID=294128 RepID=A0A979FLV8_HYAAZ|nr:GTPase-activating protein pac-1 [Hyalella azteca]